jgi:hypothetical protein
MTPSITQKVNHSVQFPRQSTHAGLVDNKSKYSDEGLGTWAVSTRDTQGKAKQSKVGRQDTRIRVSDQRPVVGFGSKDIGDLCQLDTMFTVCRRLHGAHGVVLQCRRHRLLTTWSKMQYFLDSSVSSRRQTWDKCSRVQLSDFQHPMIVAEIAGSCALHLRLFSGNGGLRHCCNGEANRFRHMIEEPVR